MVAQNLILKHTTKQELPLSNRLERLFHELGVVCCSQKLKRQVSGVISRAIFHRGSNSELYFCRCLVRSTWEYNGSREFNTREEDVSYLPNHQREPSAGRVVVFSRQEAPATN